MKKYLIVVLLALPQVHAFNCEDTKTSKFVDNLNSFFSESQGEYRLGKCDLEIEFINDCIDGEMWSYVNVILEKRGKVISYPFAFTEGNQTHKKIKVLKGGLRVSDQSINQRPKIYTELKMGFSKNYQRFNVRYESYYKIHGSVIEKHGIKKFSCSGKNPWKDQEGGLIFNASPSFWSSLKSIFRGSSSITQTEKYESF